MAHRSQVKHSTTEPLRSPDLDVGDIFFFKFIFERAPTALALLSLRKG